MLCKFFQNIFEKFNFGEPSTWAAIAAAFTGAAIVYPPVQEILLVVAGFATALGIVLREKS